MKRYMLLLRNDDEAQASMAPVDWDALLNQFSTWADDLRRRGRFQGVERLLNPVHGKTLRRRGSVVVDGPYAEGKEAVVGFVVIAAKDYDDAMPIAEEVPFLECGGMVEVREVGDFPMP